jgi:D-amino peptidase
MKVFISADMEGITGVTCWEDVDQSTPSYERFRKVMTAEVNAAIEGALMGEAKSILVNDSHGGMRNILLEELHPRAELISGSPKPMGMMCGVDSGVDLAFLVGYHAKAGTPHAMLDHTWSGSRVYAIYFNGQEMGEIGLSAALAGHFGVPVGLVAGDKAATEEAKALLGPNLRTVAVKESFTRQAARNLAPETAHAIIRGAAKAAMGGPHPEPFVIEPPVTVAVEFINSLQAAAAATVPGAQQVGGRRVEFTGADIVEAWRGMAAMLAIA